MATMPLRRIARWLAGQGNINRPNSGISLSGQTKPATPNTRFSCAIRQNRKLSIAAIPGEGVIPLKTGLGLERSYEGHRELSFAERRGFSKCVPRLQSRPSRQPVSRLRDMQVGGNCTVTGSWGLDAVAYKKLREQVLRRDGCRCQSCGGMANLELGDPSQGVSQPFRPRRPRRLDHALLRMPRECTSTLK